MSLGLAMSHLQSAGARDSEGGLLNSMYEGRQCKRHKPCCAAVCETAQASSLFSFRGILPPVSSASGPHLPRDSPMCKVKRALALLLPAERIQAAQRRSMKPAWRAGRMACVTLN